LLSAAVAAISFSSPLPITSRNTRRTRLSNEGPFTVSLSNHAPTPHGLLSPAEREKAFLHPSRERFALVNEITPTQGHRHSMQIVLALQSNGAAMRGAKMAPPRPRSPGSLDSPPGQVTLNSAGRNTRNRTFNSTEGARTRS